MAVTPPFNQAALALRPELNRFASNRLSEDPGAFKAVLTNQLGMSGQVMGQKSQDLPSSLAGLPVPRKKNGLLTFGVKDSAQARPASAALRTLSAQTQAQAQPPASPAKTQGTAAQTKPTAAEYRGKMPASEFRGSVDKSARHPDDLGHLPGPGQKSGMPQGFTREEEDLLFAAAAAESKFLTAKRQAAMLAKNASRAGSLDGTGRLSATYESGSNIDAIGYDGRGGTSYGLYQIASGVGTMSRFMRFLETQAPDIAKRLAVSGPANTGGRHGAMAQEWRKIAAENPKRFEALQHEFIRDSHYLPALKSITLSTGEDMATRSQAVREVLWSTAVQHGPNGAAEIFSQALDKLQAKGGKASDRALIEEVYSQRMAQFASRPGRTRSAVASRLADEKESALAMLAGKTLG